MPLPVGWRIHVHFPDIVGGIVEQPKQVESGVEPTEKNVSQDQAAVQEAKDQ